MSSIASNSIASLSSLHVIEHFGLGRYGDSIDDDGWKKALEEFSRVLKPRGKLFLSVPIDYEDKVCFNAHRIFEPSTIVSQLPNMKLISFAYIKEMKVIKVSDTKNLKINDDYLCGLFIFEKMEAKCSNGTFHI